jgi:uncharacterized protein (DUF1800 family)
VRFLAWLLAPLAAAVVGAGLLATPGTPNVQVFDGTLSDPLIAQNATVPFANTPVGVAGSRTFTVRNNGTGALLVSEAITVPVGFTLMASFPGVPDATLAGAPAFTLAPSATATFTVALNSAASGIFGGDVSFNTNVPSRNPVVFRVTGTAVPPPSLRILDDSDAGFTFTAGWGQGDNQATTSGGVAFQGSQSYAPVGTGSETATWTFTGLAPGQYKVGATWVGYPYGAADTPFTVLDGATPLGTVRMNQQGDSYQFLDGATYWNDLGTYTITGSTLAVQVSDDATGGDFVFADAVRVERVGYPGQVVDDTSASGFTLTPATGTWFTSYTDSTAVEFRGDSTVTGPTPTPGTPTATARWSFAVLPGAYRVTVAYSGYPWAATDAPYTVDDGVATLTPAPLRVDQTARPGDVVDSGGVGWKDLGVFTVTTTAVNVQLSNDANGWVEADAVRLERVDAATAPSAADTVRFLEQASWGPTPGLIAQVQNLGGDAFNAWLNRQFTVAVPGYPTLPLFNTNNNVPNDNRTSCYGDPAVAGNPAREACLRDHYLMYPLQNTFFRKALYDEDQLRQRAGWALHKIWVISGLDVTQPAWVAPYLQVLNGTGSFATPPHGPFGNYRTLMYDVTLNPAMGQYLNMAGSTSANPNENYPRELMQLFTIGLFELNPDGSQKLDAGGQPIPTYNQALVDAMSKVFTGWNLAPGAAGIPNYLDPMRLHGAVEDPVNHDFSAKTLLRGFVQPSRHGSVDNAYLDLNEGLDNIYNHPNVGPFVCKQLIQQLVTSNPSPAYVARVADAFNRNRSSANQLREVFRAVLLDPEARGDRKSADNYGHLKEPVLYLNNLLRMFGARADDLTQDSDGYLNPQAVNLGQDVFRPPSVFSYFSPGKVAVGGSPPVLGPELQIQTTFTAIQRANFVGDWAFFAFSPGTPRERVRGPGTIPSGTDPLTGQPLVPTGPRGTAVDVSFLLPLAGDPPALAEELNRLMLHGAMTPEMKAALVSAVSAVAGGNPRKRVRTAVYLVATSSQYQVQQ